MTTPPPTIPKCRRRWFRFTVWPLRRPLGLPLFETHGPAAHAPSPALRPEAAACAVTGLDCRAAGRSVQTRSMPRRRRMRQRPRQQHILRPFHGATCRPVPDGRHPPARSHAARPAREWYPPSRHREQGPRSVRRRRLTRHSKTQPADTTVLELALDVWTWHLRPESRGGGSGSSHFKSHETAARVVTPASKWVFAVGTR
jgi:hypothetical protein